MALKVLMRTGGVLLFVLLFFLRACIVGNAIHHARQANSYATDPNNASYAASSQSNYRYTAPATGPDSSAWIIFNSEDPQTGQRTRHSRVSSPSNIMVDGHPGPPNVLELVAQGDKEHHIRLTLQAPATCPGLTSLHASFNTRPATIAVKPIPGEPGCTVETLDYATFLQSLRFANTLTVSAGDGPEISFAVSGLSWD